MIKKFIDYFLRPVYCVGVGIRYISWNQGVRELVVYSYIRAFPLKRRATPFFYDSIESCMEDIELLKKANR